LLDQLTHLRLPGAPRSSTKTASVKQPSAVST
jgi:hypothetical protein